MSMDTKSRWVGFKERADVGVFHTLIFPEIQLSENAMQS